MHIIRYSFEFKYVLCVVASSELCNYIIAILFMQDKTPASFALSNSFSLPERRIYKSHCSTNNYGFHCGGIFSPKNGVNRKWRPQLGKCVKLLLNFRALKSKYIKLRPEQLFNSSTFQSTPNQYHHYNTVLSCLVLC